MLPSASVRLPAVEPLASVAMPAPKVPVVLKFSLPNEMAPLESVMLPSASVRLPAVEPVASVHTPSTEAPVCMLTANPEFEVPVWGRCVSDTPDRSAPCVSAFAAWVPTP